MLVKLGDNNKEVKAVQEWLCYNKISVSIDSDFGPATKAGVKQFQNMKGIPTTGIVDDATWDLFNYPITFLNMLPEVFPDAATLPEIIVNTALRHYLVKPVEIGGQNKGPFVKYYMKGYDGTAYPWCAGAVSTIVLQAFKNMSISSEDKFYYEMGCDAMYADAQRLGTLVKVPVPGCIFLSYHSENPLDCYHAGLIITTDISNGVMNAMEGNTNDSGSREGYEYIPRIRSLTNKYFINPSK